MDRETASPQASNDSVTSLRIGPCGDLRDIVSPDSVKVGYQMSFNPLLLPTAAPRPAGDDLCRYSCAEEGARGAVGGELGLENKAIQFEFLAVRRELDNPVF